MHTPWTFRQTLTGAGLTLVPWLAFALGSQLLTRGTPARVHPHRLAPSVDLTQAVVLFVVSAALEAVFLIAPLYYATYTLSPGAEGRERWRAALRALGLRLPDPGLALSAAVLAIAVILGASVAYSDILNTFHSSLKTNVDTLLAQAQYEPYTIIGTLLVAVLVAPFCEEIFFRGYLFPASRAACGCGSRFWSPQRSSALADADRAALSCSSSSASCWRSCAPGRIPSGQGSPSTRSTTRSCSSAFSCCCATNAC